MSISSNLYDLFERVVCINLPSRRDRWSEFRARLPSDWPFKPPLRFPAIDGNSVSRQDWWQSGPGAWGCLQSHLKVLNDCLEQNVQSLLVLEDDAVFVPGFAHDVRRFVAELPSDWQLVFFGGQNIRIERGLPKKISEWVYTPFNVNRGHAYALRGQEIMRRLQDHLNTDRPWPVPHHRDHHVGRLQEQLTEGLYAPREWLVAQSPGSSDISKRDTPLRLFRGCKSILECVPDRRLIAIQCASVEMSTKLATLLGQCSIDVECLPSESQGDAFGKLVSRCFDLERFGTLAKFENRTALSRIWATRRSTAAQSNSEFMTESHPLMVLMFQEIQHWSSECLWIVVEEDEKSLRDALRCRYAQLSSDSLARLTNLVIERTRKIVANSHPRVLRVSNATIASPAAMQWLECFLGS